MEFQCPLCCCTLQDCVLGPVSCSLYSCHPDVSSYGEQDNHWQGRAVSLSASQIPLQRQKAAHHGESSVTLIGINYVTVRHKYKFASAHPSSKDRHIAFCKTSPENLPSPPYKHKQVWCDAAEALISAASVHRGPDPTDQPLWASSQ